MLNPGQLATQVQTKLQTLVTLTRAGIVHPERPDHLWHTARALLRYGTTPAAGYTAAARNFPDEPAVIDELGTLSFRELDERTNALARALQADGIERGRRRRDHVPQPPRLDRGDARVLASSAPTRSSSTPPSPARSWPTWPSARSRRRSSTTRSSRRCSRTPSARRKRYVAWVDGKSRDPHLEDVIAAGDTRRWPRPTEQGRAIILTSGTTGTPKGASRSMPKSIDPIASLLSVIPLQSAREKTMLAAPLFHAWGFAQWALGISLGTTVVLSASSTRRRRSR